RRVVVRMSGLGLLQERARFIAGAANTPAAERGAFALDWECLPGSKVGVQMLQFPGPASATGEDVLEFHLPGSQPLVDAFVAQMIERGARLAEPGEFTRRAFLRGQLDLTQAEAVLDLVSSRSSQAARAAATLLHGALGQSLTHTRDVLLRALVEMEAGLDFEEGDSQDLQPGEVGHLLAEAEAALRDGLASEEARQLRQEGSFRIGLIGPPNAGKTSLFAFLTQTPALVSDQAGTTRDRREAIWETGTSGLPLTLVDFPGLGGDAVDLHDDAARTLAASEDARLDLVWLCLAPNQPPDALPDRLPEVPFLIVWTQADRLPGAAAPDLRLALRSFGTPLQEVQIGQQGAMGQSQLRNATADALQQAEEAQSQSRQHSRRHQEALQGALTCLQRGQQWDAQGGHQDLVAEDIRAALAVLSELVGEATPEEVLDCLFASFCVGK
ncbi:MAG: GTPase, partial [Planctomycetota bacterium]